MKLSQAILQVQAELKKLKKYALLNDPDVDCYEFRVKIGRDEYGIDWGLDYVDDYSRPTPKPKVDPNAKRKIIFDDDIPNEYPKKKAPSEVKSVTSDDGNKGIEWSDHGPPYVWELGNKNQPSGSF